MNPHAPFPFRVPLLLGFSLTVTALALTLSAMLLLERRGEGQSPASSGAALPGAETPSVLLADARSLNQAMAGKLATVTDTLALAQTALGGAPPVAEGTPGLVATAAVREVPTPAANGMPTTDPPRVWLETNGVGGVTERRIFSALLGADGRPLARDAEFSRSLGRRLFFRTPHGPPLGFDVDQLHPDVLHYLGLESGRLKAAQDEMNRQKQLAVERAEKERQERLEGARNRQEALQKALAGRAAAGQAGVSGDQLVTLAALRAMESANARAQTPPVIVVPQPQPVHYWTWPVVWVPRTPCPTPQPPPSTPSPQNPSGSNFQFISDFRFIQQNNPFDPFANGRRL